MYFEVKSSASNSKLYMVTPTQKLCDIVLSKVGKMKGSYMVLEARFFGLNYYDYLRMVEDKYNATIYPTTQRAKYYSILFNEEKDASALCKELNRRATYVIKTKD